jgi:hypothetical protein
VFGFPNRYQFGLFMMTRSPLIWWWRKVCRQTPDQAASSQQRSEHGGRSPFFAIQPAGTRTQHGRKIGRRLAGVESESAQIRFVTRAKTLCVSMMTPGRVCKCKYLKSRTKYITERSHRRRRESANACSRHCATSAVCRYHSIGTCPGSPATRSSQARIAGNGLRSKSHWCAKWT